MDKFTEKKEKDLYLPYFISLAEFAAGIAHEINNPLSSLMAAIEYISSNKEAEIFLDEINLIRNSAKRISSIIKDVILFADTQKDSIKEIFEAKEAVKSIVGIVRNHYRSEGIEISEKYEADKLFVMGRRGIFQNAIFNLLKNSYDAIKGLKTKGQIQIKVLKKTDYILIEIHDDGRGIPEEYKDRVFLPFFTTKSHTQGIGFGLSFVKKAVDEFGGNIHFISKEGVGTSFFVEIPVYNVKEIEEDENHAIVFTKRNEIEFQIRNLMSKLGWNVERVEDLTRMIYTCSTCDANRCLGFVDMKNIEIPYQEVIERIERNNNAMIIRLIFITDLLEPDWLRMLKYKGIRFILEPFTIGEILQVI